MLPKDFLMWVKGHNARIKSQHEIARRQAYFATVTQMNKPISMAEFYAKFWPLPGDVDEDKESQMIERYKALKAKLANGK